MPTGLCGHTGNLDAALRRHFGGTGLAAFQAALTTQDYGGLILVGCGTIRRTIFDLAGKYIADQLAELHGITGAG